MRHLLLLALVGCLHAPPRPVEPGRSWGDAVVYGVVPFFFEGGFVGVADRVDEIAALGADVLWLSPIAACPDDDFGYAITDHTALRDTFGTDAELRALITRAHAHELAVIVDLALNHTSDQHPWFLSEATAHHYEDGTYYFDWANLPNLNYDEPVVREAMLDALQWWVETYDVDGFRLDAAWGIARRAPDFLPEARRRLGPDVLLIAEASARDPVWAGQGVDAAYDWTDALGVWAWREAFDDAEHTASRLREAIVGSEVPVVRFLDNNDTGERFAQRYGVGVTRVAVGLLMTLPGIPVVFTGSEVGADLDVYQEGPPLDWADPHGLSATYAEWIALRRRFPELRGADLRWVATEDPVLAYWRGDLLVGLSFGGASAIPAQDRALVDVRDGSRWPAGRPIPLPAHGARLLAPG